MKNFSPEELKPSVRASRLRPPRLLGGRRRRASTHSAFWRAG